MRRFSRAAYYLCALDFDFATRVQSLLSKFERNYYVERLGAERWSSLPAWQQVAMLAMVRDLYRPNVGHLGYNVYALPELNCAPLEFVASSAAAATNLGKNQETLWRPDNYDVLWAGAGYQLSVLNEVWTVVYGHSMHGVGKTSTTDAAHEIVVLNR